ncbi:hypothetical protein ACEPAI_7741 [Sanghuangporus weigelae]
MAQVKKPPNKNNASQSQSVIKKGAQDVSTRDKSAGEKAVVLASTKRALQLRNGKGGSFGTGEVVRIPGREKLELIAEDEMEKAREERRRNLYEDTMKSSLKAPFQLDTVLRITQSQMDAYIDFINALRDPALCYDIVLREVEAHCPPRTGRQDADLMRDPSFVAEQFGICVHNAHMLASGWVILYESFRKLRDMGLRDKEIRTQLRSNSEIRDEYFSAYELLKKLVSSLQHRLRSIVQNTPHYAPYFKASSEARDCQEFENSEIKRMYKSFLDSAIIELCLPGSKFSPQALYFCLHTTQEETPRLLRRCPQLMWDAVGDLAEAVRLLDVMESPLISRDAEGGTERNFTLFNECAQWNEAQEKSVRSAMQYSNFVNLVHPLETLKVKAKLDAIWEQLDSNYIRETGNNIDVLWRLVDARRRVPHFSILSIEEEALEDAPQSSGKELVLARGNGKPRPKPKRITNDDDSDSGFSSMPSLKAISDSEEEFEEFGSDDSDDDDDSEDDEYDSDAEEELKRQQREAIDKALEDPDVLDLNNDKYAEERKKNPLLSLLGNLRGRLFSSSAILRTDEEPAAAPRPSKPSTAQKPAAKPPTAPGTTGGVARKETPLKTALEDADDESDVQNSAAEKKKKKHKKKKKKKKSIGTDEKPLASEPPTSPTSEPPRSPSPTPEPQVAPPALAVPPQTSRAEKKQPNKKSPSVKTQTTTKSSLSEPTSFASTTTLQLPQEQKAPSARSYLKEIPGAKTKVKTRREPATEANAETTPVKKDRKGGLFGRFKGRDGDESKEDRKKKKQESDLSVFARLRKKTAGHLRKLLGVSAQDKKGSLKWEQFLQVMRELGFDYDPSTAGSSVRFDPPNPDVRSITFHKPHPDPTLHQNILKEYRAKLEDYYGWSPEKFKKAMDGVAAASSDSDY